jgi:hypothetical protein
MVGACRSFESIACTLRAALVCWAALGTYSLAQGSVGPIVFARGEADVEPVEASDRFGEGIGIVYAFFEFEELTGTDILSGVWYRDGATLLTQATTLGQVLGVTGEVPEGKLYFSISFNDGAGPGVYRLEVSLNAALVQTGEFTVLAASEPQGERAEQAASDLQVATEPASQSEIRLSWGETAQQLGGSAGSSFTALCQANGGGGKIWGTDVYTDDSSICLAAVHAGVITPEGGLVLVTIRESQAAYEASTRNGVSSRSYGYWARSFEVSPPGESAQAAREDAAGAAAEPACQTYLANMVAYQNGEHGYCVVHDSRWEVVERGSENVTIQIPAAGAPERMGVNIQAIELAVPTPLDEAFGTFTDSLWESFEDLSNVEILERGDAVVSSLPARMLEFSGDLTAQNEQFEVIGRIYGVQSHERKLYVLTFVMDTTRVPLQGYRPTQELLLASFTLAPSGEGQE